MVNGGKNIIRIKLYKCGFCENNLGHVFKHHKKEKRLFPALVVLIQHKELGNILYDTGYSDLIYKNHFVSFLYNAINKTYVEDSDTITSKLLENSIDPESIHNIILSHAHPDHIGGLRFFENYKLISTQKVIDTLKGRNPFKLVFRNMIPDGKVRYEAVGTFEGDSVLSEYFEKLFDVLGDGSVVGVELNGHAEGQLGIYLPEYKKLFVADACWGADLLSKVQSMRFIPRRIQNNYKEYVETAKKIERFMTDHPDIDIIYSHDKMEEIRYE